MAYFGAYGCCKLCLRDLCVPTICFFASSALKIGESPKIPTFDQKMAIVGRFFHEKWQILVHTEAVNCVCVTCMHQNLLFFIGKLPKMAVSWSKIEYFGLRQAVAEPPPPILRVLDAKKHAVWTH